MWNKNSLMLQVIDMDNELLELRKIEEKVLKILK